MDNLIKKAGELLLSYNFDIWDIFFENSEFKLISLENSKVEQFNTGTISGTGIRGVNNNKIFYTYTDNLNEKNFLNLIKNINNNPVDLKKQNLKKQKIKSFLYETESKIPHKKIRTDEKVDLLRELNSFIRQISSDIKQVKITLSEKNQNVKILNDKGNFINEKRVYTSFIFYIVAGRLNSIETGYSVIAGCGGYELLKREYLKQKARQVAESALRLLDLKEKLTGVMPAVIAAEAGGTLIHEAVGHSLEADLVQKGLSEYVGKIGKKVASSLITVIDDATIPGRRGSYGFDDEGTKASKTVLIENGILKNYLYDRVSALKDNTKSTGNGRRESYYHISIPRMSNIYIKPQKGKQKDLIKDTKKGIFIKKMGGGQVNTVTGEFIFEIKEGFKIEKGKITKPVRDATLMGRGPEILKSIDAVCDDLGFESGTCGKDGQGVPVSDAQPTIRVPQILIGSK